MAGAGVRLFTAGSQLLASQVNTYLMDQVVCVFADSGARTAAFVGNDKPSLSPGRLSYLLSDSKLYLYGNDNQWTEIGAQLDNLEVTTAKIDNLAVTEAKLAADSVTSAKIVDGTIVNADINASAAIALSKLASGTSGQIIVANASGVPTYVTLGGEATINSSGQLTISSTAITLGTETVGNYVATVSGTANQVTVSGSGSESAAITVSLPQDIATTSNPTFAGVTADLVQIGVTSAGEIDTSSGNLTIDSAGGTTTIDDNVTITGNLTINGSSVTSQNTSQGYATTATSAGTTTLTSTSTYLQYFTGSTTHTVVLPVTSTLQLGTGYEFHNNSTGVITINSSGGNLVTTVQSAQTMRVTCILVTGTTASSWDSDVTGGTSSTGTGSLVFAGSPTFTGTPTLPTGTIATTQTAGNSTTAIATTAFVATALTSIPNSSTTATSANTANTIVARDANGDFNGRIIKAVTVAQGINRGIMIAADSGDTSSILQFTNHIGTSQLSSLVATSNLLTVSSPLAATSFSGPLTGNVTGNVTGSSGSCTGNAATATTASTVSNGSISETKIDYTTVPKQTVSTSSPSGGKQHDIWIKVA